MVLLKNGKRNVDQVVPLPKKVKKILVAGQHANNMGWQCGGFTLTWQGFNGTGEEIGRNKAMGLPTGKTRGNVIRPKDTQNIYLLIRSHMHNNYNNFGF